jgi:hypothetical protein
MTLVMAQKGMPTMVLQYFHDQILQFFNDYKDTLNAHNVGMPNV